MIITIIVAVLIAIMGIVILIGKGDNLIAGYNTASKEERAKCNIKRLRYLTGGVLVVLAPMMILLIMQGTIEAIGIFMALTMILCFIVLVLANTWAKKKG